MGTECLFPRASIIFNAYPKLAATHRVQTVFSACALQNRAVTAAEPLPSLSPPPKTSRLLVTVLASSAVTSLTNNRHSELMSSSHPLVLSLKTHSSSTETISLMTSHRQRETTCSQEAGGDSDLSPWLGVRGGKGLEESEVAQSSGNVR